MGKLEEIIANIFELDLSQIKKEMTPADIETWDSLSQLNLISAVEKEFKIKLEFSEIFTQLKDVATSDILAKKASFMQVSKQLYLVCIDWHFIDGQGQVFADFAAFYQVLNINGALKIVNVTSHELESSLTLAEPLSW